MIATNLSDDWGDLDAGRQRLRDFIADRCVITADREPLTDSRGRPHAWLLDIRPALLQGWATRLIARCFWHRMAAAWPFQVAGIESAAMPLVGAIVALGDELGFPVTGLAVRRERKAYGRCRAIEGEVTRLPVVLVDDMLNSGRTVVKAIVTLHDEGATVARLFTVVDFRSPVGADKIETSKLLHTSLFSLGEFGLSLPTPRKAAKLIPPLAVRWRFEPVERRQHFVARKAAPVVAGDQVLHATEDGWLHAIHSATGTIAWGVQLTQRSTKGLWSTPVVADGHAFIGSYDGTVLKISLVDGGVAWRFHGAEWVGSSPAITPDGSTLYIGVEWGNGRGEGGIVCLDTASGMPSWEVPIPAQVHASPAVLADGGIVCGANDGCLHRVSADGTLHWSTPVGGDIKGGVGVSDDGQRLFVATADGGIVALDAASGEQAWRVQTGGPVFGTPLPHEDLLACTSTDGRLRLLDIADGREVRGFAIGGKVFAAPVLVGDALVVGAATGRLVQLSWSSLDVLAEHQFAERIVSEVAVDNRTLFVPTYDGRLYAIERNNP